MTIRLGPSIEWQERIAEGQDRAMDAICQEILWRQKMLRCKFRIEQIIKEGTGRHLKLCASNQTDGDNKDWSQWTPNGKFEIYVTNIATFEKIDALNPGDHFYIDMTPVCIEVCPWL